MPSDDVAMARPSSCALALSDPERGAARGPRRSCSRPRTPGGSRWRRQATRARAAARRGELDARAPGAAGGAPRSPRRRGDARPGRPTSRATLGVTLAMAGRTTRGSALSSTVPSPRRGPGPSRAKVLMRRGYVLSRRSSGRHRGGARPTPRGARRRSARPATASGRHAPSTTSPAPPVARRRAAAESWSCARERIFVDDRPAGRGGAGPAQPGRVAFCRGRPADRAAPVRRRRRAVRRARPRRRRAGHRPRRWPCWRPGLPTRRPGRRRPAGRGRPASRSRRPTCGCAARRRCSPPEPVSATQDDHAARRDAFRRPADGTGSPRAPSSSSCGPARRTGRSDRRRRPRGRDGGAAARGRAGGGGRARLAARRPGWRRAGAGTAPAERAAAYRTHRRAARARHRVARPRPRPGAARGPARRAGGLPARPRRARPAPRDAGQLGAARAGQPARRGPGGPGSAHGGRRAAAPAAGVERALAGDLADAAAGAARATTTSPARSRRCATTPAACARLASRATTSASSRPSGGGSRDALRSRLHQTAGAGGRRAGDARRGRRWSTPSGDGSFVELVEVGGTLHALVVSGGRVRRHEVGPVAAADQAVGRDGVRAAPGGARTSGPRWPRRARASSARCSGRPPAGCRGRSSCHRPAGCTGCRGGCCRRSPTCRTPSCRRPRSGCAPGSGRRPRTGGCSSRGPGLTTGGAEIDGRRAAARRTPSSCATVPRPSTTRWPRSTAPGSRTSPRTVTSAPTRRSSPPSTWPTGRSPSTTSSASTGRRTGSCCRPATPACWRPVGAGELLGLVSALLAIGTAGVVASVAVVNDEATVDVMVDVHAALDDGADLATALHRARSAAAGDPTRAATAAAFLALGV